MSSYPLALLWRKNRSFLFLLLILWGFSYFQAGAHPQNFTFSNSYFSHYPQKTIQTSYPTGTLYSPLQAAPHKPVVSFKQDCLETSKIVLMTTVSAVVYGITHDLITTQLNFDYFASDRTHHGPYTRKHFPYVYKSHNKVLYALLWGTISTWWVGLPLGILWSLEARWGSHAEKLGWQDLIKLDAMLMGGMLATSLIVGTSTYLMTQDSFQMVEAMHLTSYLTGIVGGIMMAFYIDSTRKPFTNFIRFEPNGIAINLASFLYND